MSCRNTSGATSNISPQGSLGISEPVHLPSSDQEPRGSRQGGPFSNRRDAAGPFAYAERWDESKQTYAGLAISGAASAQVVIDSESIIIKPDAAEAHRPKAPPVSPSAAPPSSSVHAEAMTRPPVTAGLKQYPKRPRTRHATDLRGTFIRFLKPSRTTDDAAA